MIDSKSGIIGLAIGDAMGVPLEFCIREKLMQNPTTEMLGYGSHDVPKGSWSDDSSMTFATIDAIIKDKVYVGNARYSYKNANQNVQPNELLIAFKNNE